MTLTLVLSRPLPITLRLILILVPAQAFLLVVNEALTKLLPALVPSDLAMTIGGTVLGG